MTRIRLICIQTHYPHWSKYSGYHQYLQYLGDAFKVEHAVVGDDYEMSSNVFMRRMVQGVGYRYRTSLPTRRVDIENEWKLIRRLRGERQFDRTLVHFMDGEYGYCFAGVYKQLGLLSNQIKLVATFHQPCSLLNQMIAYPKRLKQLDGIMLVGSSQAGYFNNMPMPCYIHKHGVDTNFFRPGKGKDFREKRLICITVGHWLRDMNCLRNVISRSGDQFVFRVVGKREEIGDIGAMRNVELYSNVTDERLLNLYQTAHVGLMPLVDSTANNALLEMLACGLPVVVTNVGSVMDYVNEDCVILVDRDADQEIVVQLNRFREDEDMCINLSENARKTALELDWRLVAREIAGQYMAISEL